eukprot:TRINITY_DN0_c0_g3_i1.p1 TRINITY_DN0_c0_g3~~TRINITY_DN0_c0_g3_i1.p1  ORF type:complete len:705 (-),score=273.09 TRINITY_DN0_c0_g3_i1:137-2251(-)
MTKGMVNVVIDGQSIEVAEGTTIFDAASQAGIRIPTLCHHPRLPPAGKCGVCVVEVKGDDFPFKTSCTAEVCEGMVVRTNSPSVKAKRIEAIRTNIVQPNSTPAPSFQTVEMEELMRDTLDSSNALVRDPALCVGCTRCVRACDTIAGMNVLKVNMNEGAEPIVLTDENASGIQETDCISCGQCLNFCPTDSIADNSSVKFIDAMLNSGKVMVVQTAPSPRVALSEEFGCPSGEVSTTKMVGALKACGFHYVFDTNFGADMTIVEEANEFLHRLNTDGVFPMFTSCCPGWINMAEKLYPELIPNLSSCRSPMMMLAPVIKTYWAEKMDVKPEDIFHVALMPCTAKKDEIQREQHRFENGIRFVDSVITTREFAQLMKMRGLEEWEMVPEMEFDNPMGECSGAAAIFGATGGVMEAALRTAYEKKTGKLLENVDFQACRGMEGFKSFEVDVEGANVKIGIVNAGVNARKVIRKIIDKEPGFDDFHFIEVMACAGGCIGGGGQPRSLDPMALKKRVDALYAIDVAKTVRRSHKNPSIIRLYDEFFEGTPGGHKAHEMLHCKYENRKRIVVEEESTKKTIAVGEGGVVVLYGSQGGTTAQAARTLEAELLAVSNGKVPIRCVAMADYDPKNLNKEEKVVMLTCTYGRGEFPDAAKPFWAGLNDPELPEDYLKNVQFTVFGLGSSQYKFFCRAARQLDERFENLGAHR